MVFAYNNSFHSSISMARYKAFYGMMFRSLIGWFEVGEPSLLGPELIYKTLEMVYIISNRLRTAFSRQKSYVDRRRRIWSLNKVIVTTHKKNIQINA